MKKKLLSLFVLTLSISLYATGTIELGGVLHTIDTVSAIKAGPGTMQYFMQLKKTTNQNPLEVFVLQVDTKNPYISVEQVLGKDLRVGTERPTVMAERKTTPTKIYFAGVNGDFYANLAPVGYTICNNEYVYAPASTNRRIGAVDEQYKGKVATTPAFTGEVTLKDGQKVAIKHVNRAREENDLILYNHYEGATTGTNAYGTELLCELPEGEAWHTTTTLHPVVLKNEYRVGSMVMTGNQFVLSAHGTSEAILKNAQQGDTLTMQLQLTFDGEPVNISHAIGGDDFALIVHNGKSTTENFWNELHPRTAYGHSVTGDTIIMMVVDGRNSKRSVGVTTQVLGQLMKHYGAYEALNWDGGGSSNLYVRHLGQVNNGSDGSERPVTNAMFAVANLPEADEVIAELIPYHTSEFMPKYGVVTLHCYGYNKYGVMVSNDVEGMELSCDPATGYVNENGDLVAVQSGEVTIKKGGATTKVNIEVANSPIALRLDSVLLGVGRPYNAEVVAYVGEVMMPAYAPAFEWGSEDESIATVKAGTITGVANGVTKVWCKIGEFTDSIQVRVEAPTKSLLLLDYQQDTTVSFKSTRNATIEFETALQLYGVPDSILLTINTDAPIASFDLYMKANNAEAPISRKTAQAVPQSEDYIYRMAIQDFFPELDPAIYPLTITEFKWTLKDPKKNTPYNMQIKRVELLYNDIIQTGLEGVQTSDGTKKVLTPQGVFIRTSSTQYDLLGRERM